MKTIAPNPAAETPEFMQRTDKQFSQCHHNVD
jgi:hypothetical protein